MRRLDVLQRLAVVLCVGVVLAARPSAAQDMAGLTFDVRVTTGDSAAGSHQTGRGWIAGKRARLDLRGSGIPAETMPGMVGMPGQSISMILHDSGGSQAVIMLDHDNKKVMYPSRMMEQLQEMMATLPDQPRMSFSVTNVVVDSLGAGETVSGFATKRFRLKADITMAVEVMGESMNQTMYIESEGDYAEELSDYTDPLQSSRAFQAFTSGMSWMDSSATTEMNKIALATPRGLVLRQVDRVTGVFEGLPSQATVTALSNIKRATFSPSVFEVPEDYTEMEMPEIPDIN